MASVIGGITIKDNATAVLRNVRTEQQKLSQSAKAMGGVLKSVWGKTHTLKVKTEEARKKLQTVKAEMKKFKPVSAVLKAKDVASKTIRKVHGGLQKLKNATVSPIVKVTDKASHAIKGILGGIGKAVKTVAIPVAVAGGVAATALAASASAGMKLEQQQISIEHFIGATNKDLSSEEVKSQSKSYIQPLRENANATPFETGDVIQAGSRAVSLSNGNISEAMNMVTLAEDMAAASGGTKSIMDAMEALGDLKVGETERLKEFGFKVSAEEFKKKDFSGVSGDLSDFYGGSAEKLAGSGAGLMSTINGKLKSNMADFGLGIVEEIKPVLSDVISLIDTAQPTIKKLSEAFGQKLFKGIGIAKSAISQFSGTVTSVSATLGPTVSTAMEVLQPVFQNTVTVVSALGSGIMAAVSQIAPVIVPILSGIAEKSSVVIGILAEKSDFIQSVIETAGTAIGEALTAIWIVGGPVLDVLIAAFDLVLSTAEKVWPGVSSVISEAWKLIKPIFDVMGKGISAIADAMGSLNEKIKGLSPDSIKGLSAKIFGSPTGKKVGRNARGDNHWRGGPTWVGEEGPEIIDLPRGTRILPNKESVTWASARQSAEIIEMPRKPDYSGLKAGGSKNYHVTIAKLADTVMVQKEEDKEELAEATAKKLLEALDNIA